MENEYKTIDTIRNQHKSGLNLNEIEKESVSASCLLKTDDLITPEKYEKDVEPPTFILDEINQALEKVANYYSAFFENIGNVLLSVSEPFVNIISILSENQEIIRENLTENDSYLRAWGDFGWIPTEEFMDICRIKLFCPVTQEDADNQMMDYFERDSGTLRRELQESWEANDHIFNNAIECYERGLYYAAGLAIFSGIENEIQKNINKKKGIHGGARHFNNNFTERLAIKGSVYFPLVKVMQDILKELYLPFEGDATKKKIAKPNDLNRNLMFHGKSRDLTKLEVIKLFLVWNGLAKANEYSLISKEY